MRHISWQYSLAQPHYFNPRTREGCDVPTTDLQRGDILFQSTHPRGVRRLTDSCLMTRLSFQSTHPRGVRPDVYEDFEEFLDISIHAPARGATYAWNEWARRGRNFNPRTHGECDPQDPQGSQDTLHISIHALTGSATKSASGKFLSIIISIHALTGSATKLYMGVTPDKYISIHALTGSATVFFLAFHIFCIISIHALTGSATSLNSKTSSINFISIHALTGSATPKNWRRGSKYNYFNPRTHGECDTLCLCILRCVF